MKQYIALLFEKWQTRKKIEFSKLVVGFLMLNGSVWIYMSYALAYLGREEIAETLSKTVAAEVFGVMAVYSAKALFENISKNNSWPDKTNKTDEQKDC